jgi:hypothetical protein
LEENEESNNGWVLKAPYTTNCHYVRFCKTMHSVLNNLFIANIKLFGSIPYVMLQACMKNRQEYKVVVFNEEVQFVTANARRARPSISFSKRPHYKLIQFAQDAVQDLKKSCPEFLCDGLVRVDIFQNENGDMIVNEFESLGANYYTNNDVDMLFSQKLVHYWELKLTDYVSFIEKTICIDKKNKNK